jgi:tetratricopeptide (TPR) repeat protein
VESAAWGAPVWQNSAAAVTNPRGSTIADRADGKGLSAEGRVPVAAVLADRYERLLPLAEDAGVGSFLADDARVGTVLVKVLEMGGARSALRMRLAHVTGILASLRDADGDPFLLEHGTAGEFVWVARPFLPGRSLAERLAEGPLDVDGTLAVAEAALRRLVAANAHGIIHRGVKPANIILQSGSGRPVLVDFAMTRSVHLRAGSRGGTPATARYLSPEQAGLIESPSDERSDLYSLGVTLFECLAGRPLADGGTVEEIRVQHLEDRPQSALEDPDIPKALVELVTRLVRAEPSERYQEAEAVLDDVSAIISGRREGVPDPPVVIGRSDRRRVLADPGFIGRRAERSALEAELASLTRGNGTVVSIAGESGSGKSRLLDEVARMAATSGILVLRGQGQDRTASRPFEIFAGVAAGLAAAAHSTPELASRLTERFADRAEAIAGAAPPLAPFAAAGGGKQVLPEEHGQARAVEALASVLEAAGSPDRPALVILDDCQWAPTLTAAVVEQWTSRAGPRWTAVVVAFRSEEVPMASPLRALDTSRDLLLAELTDTEVGDLVLSMAGPVPDAAVERVVDAAKGNAFMAQAVLRGMIEGGTLVRVGREWQLDMAAPGGVQTSRDAALLLLERLEVLPDSTRRLLASAAVVAKTADLELVVALSGLDDASAFQAIDEGRRRRILWLDERSARVAFAHDIVRETILRDLSQEEATALHQRAAAHYLDRPEEAPFQVAYHLDRAGLVTEAFPHAMRAAEVARSRHALEDAESYYIIARKGAVDPQSRFLVADGLAEIMSLAGRYSEAEAYLEEASAVAEDPVDQAAELGKLGEVAFRRGDQAKAAARLETAIRGLGGWVPRWQLIVIVGLVWEVVIQTAHSVTGNQLTIRRHLSRSQELRLRFYSRLAYVYWFRNGRIRCLWVHLKEMNLAERAGPSAALAQAYSEHAPVMTTIPWYARGIRYADRSRAMRRDLGDTWGEGQSLNFYGVALYAASRYRESLEAFEQAIQILSLTGDRWEMNTARWNLALAHYRLGDWAVATEMAVALHESAERIGDQSSSAIALSIWARTSSGAHPDAVVVEEAAARPNDDQHSGSELQLARALLLLAGSRPTEAAEVLEAGWATVRRAGLRQEYVAPVLSWWATALRQRVAAMAPDDPHRRAATRRARQVSRRAVRLSRSYRNNLPHALRERALIEVLGGRPRRGRTLLQESAQVAAGQEAAWEEARSREELARLDVAEGRPGSEAELEAQAFRVAMIEAAGRGGDPIPT